MKKLICFALVAALLFSLCACDKKSGGKPIITVDQSALYASLGEKVVLPKAEAEAFDGSDISENIAVEVRYGSTPVFSGKGNVENSFTPEKEGEYTAEYCAEDKQGLFSDTLTVNILITDSEVPETERIAPVITVDRENVNVYVDAEITTKIARGYDEYDKDISAEVDVRVTDCLDKEVFSGDGNTENVLKNLAVGTYSVDYSLKNSAGIAAEPAGYLLTVVANDNTAPMITAPKKDYRLKTGEAHVVPAATAEDYEDGELPVTYVVENADGAAVANGKADVPVLYTFTEAGSYTVMYSCEDSEGVKASSSYKVEVVGVTEDGIIIDGVPDEKEYLAVERYVLGVSGNTTYGFIVTDGGLYVSADVDDVNLIASNLTDKDAKLNNSDGVDFVFDPMDTNAGWLNLSDDCAYCFRIRIGVDGTVAYYKPLRFNGGDNASDQWKLMADEDIPDGFLSAVSVDGTIAVKGERDETTADTGYSVEVFFPWEMFGYVSRPDLDPNYGKEYIRCGFGQRDVTHTTLYNSYNANCSDPSSRNNICFNGMNVTGRPKASSEGLHLGLYSYLYVAGDMLGVNPCSTGEDPVVLDGCMSEPFWKDATDIPTPESSQGAEVITKLKTTENGIYMGVYVADGDVTANHSSAFVNNYGISGNDMIDVRIISGEEMELSALVPYASQTFTDGKIILFDPQGSMLLGMLQQMGVNRTIRQYPLKYGVYVDGDCAYSSTNEIWLSGNQFVADSGNRVTDSGWGIEVFFPWETVGLSAPSENNPEVEFMAMSAVYDRDSDSITNASWVYSHRSATSISKSDPTNPSTYFPVKVTYNGEKI